MTELGEKILELTSKGYGYRRIIEELGCSRATISYWRSSEQREKANARSKKNRQLNPWMRKKERFQNGERKGNIRHKTYDFKRRGGSSLTTEEVRNKLENTDRCYLTGRPIDANDIRTYQFDHIIPHSKGGDNTLSNLGICTPEANKAKNDLTVDEFVKLCKDVLINFGYEVT